MGSEYIYKVWDTQTETYWKSFKGRSAWSQPHHAAAAWNCGNWNVTDYYDPIRDLKFKEQTRFVIHKFELVQVPYG